MSEPRRVVYLEAFVSRKWEAVVDGKTVWGVEFKIDDWGAEGTVVRTYRTEAEASEFVVGGRLTIRFEDVPDDAPDTPDTWIVTRKETR